LNKWLAWGVSRPHPKIKSVLKKFLNKKTHGYSLNLLHSSHCHLTIILWIYYNKLMIISWSTYDCLITMRVIKIILWQYHNYLIIISQSYNKTSSHNQNYEKNVFFNGKNTHLKGMITLIMRSFNVKTDHKTFCEWLQFFPLKTLPTIILNLGVGCTSHCSNFSSVIVKQVSPFKSSLFLKIDLQNIQTLQLN